LPGSPRFANDLTRRDEFGTFLSKWRDYQFKVANSVVVVDGDGGGGNGGVGELYSS